MSTPNTAVIAPSSEASEASAANGIRRQAMLLTAGCIAAALLCLVLLGSTRSAAATLAARRARAHSLAADARAIAKLHVLPQQATETDLPRSDLLDRVAEAMRAAGLDAESLASTLPQPPRKLPGSDHAEVSHRLVFEDVRIEPLIRFCHTLTNRNPALRISALHLRAGQDARAWNADVNVAQWVVAPVSANHSSTGGAF